MIVVAALAGSLESAKVLATFLGRMGKRLRTSGVINCRALTRATILRAPLGSAKRYIIDAPGHAHQLNLNTGKSKAGLLEWKFQCAYPCHTDGLQISGAPARRDASL